MADQDEVQRLIERTRANREKLNRHLHEFGESPHPIRSPLRERNDSSPVKVNRSLTFTKSPSRGSNPSPVNKQSYSREVSESKTTIEDSPKREGNKETFVTTTITEKEEKIHKTEHVKFSTTRPIDSFDDEIFGASGRKKRLAKLAEKFHDIEEEDTTKVDMNVTKEVDVDEEIAGMQEPSNDTPKMAKDPQFLKSLRAQGFEESASKAKLVYDFKKKDHSPVQVRKSTILSSPTKTAAEPRPSSPHKPHPLQFVSPKISNAARLSSPAKNTKTPVAPRLQSPVKNVKTDSPSRPHPLQFVSPQRSREFAKKPLVEAPDKPARSWNMAKDGHQVMEEKTTKSDRNDDAMTDTASRKSLAEKWSMFEQQTKNENSASSPQVDPSMMSLSERRALFEKNRTAPVPIARFGDAVTPSMLFKGQSRLETSDKASLPQQEASTPRAPPSPPKQRLMSPQKMNPPGKAPSPLLRTGKTSPSRKSPFKNASQTSSSVGETWKPSSPVHHSPGRKDIQPHLSPPSGKKSPRGLGKREQPQDDRNYPGVHSMKRIKVSPPKDGQLYPQIQEGTDDERPGTSMSIESVPSEAPSEAPSLGAAIKRAANAYRMIHERRHAMPSISEGAQDDEKRLDASESAEIDDILDEAMDETFSSSEGPTPPKTYRQGLSPTSSAASWEFQTPGNYKPRVKDFKTPLVEDQDDSPQGALPQVEGAEGGTLLHTVSFYRRQQPSVQVTPQQKIVRRDEIKIQDEHPPREDIQHQIKKLHTEVEEQRQRMEQASKALNFCVSKGEFEGSAERVEGERLLLDATHKYSAATAEIKRLSTEGAIGKADPESKHTNASKGSISISALSLPLKADFLRMLRTGGDDTVHYFVVLLKYRGRVISTQMLCTMDGISGGKLAFPNLINLRDLDFNFQVYVEVYGLQTRREHIPHDVKYHIKKEKSMFNLTPIKKLKKQDSSPLPRTNPVNNKIIRRPAFGMVGYAVINIETLKNRAFRLEKVPEMSPLDGGLEMTLMIHPESRIDQRGFLTLFTDVNGYGDWCRRWCRLTGYDMHFWKYPEDEGKKEPNEIISLSSCVTDNVTLAPKDVCSRMNTFMLETKRPWKHGDQDSLIMHVNQKSGLTTIRHLLSADTRDERVAWCALVNKALETIRAWNPNAFRPRSDSQGSSVSADSSNTATSASTDIW